VSLNPTSTCVLAHVCRLWVGPSVPVADVPLLVAVASVTFPGLPARFTVPPAAAYVPPRAREVVV
jgi:hypothetical protein